MKYIIQKWQGDSTLGFWSNTRWVESCQEKEEALKILKEASVKHRVRLVEFIEEMGEYRDRSRKI